MYRPMSKTKLLAQRGRKKLMSFWQQKKKKKASVFISISVTLFKPAPLNLEMTFQLHLTIDYTLR